MDVWRWDEFLYPGALWIKALGGVFLSLKAFLVDCPVFLKFSSFCKLNKFYSFLFGSLRKSS